MIRECVYFETSDGKVFEKLTDAQKHESTLGDPLIYLINKVFTGYTVDLRKALYNAMNTRRDEFIKALMKDKLEELSENTKVDEVLNRLYEERNLPEGRHKKYRIKINP